MRVLKNVSAAELDYFTKQPTAKKLHEKIMREADYIPQGDRKAAANYVAQRAAEKQTRNDTVEISREGYALQAEQNKPTASFGDYSFPVTQGAAKNNFVIHFDNSAMLHRVVEKGSLAINGEEVSLSDDVKNRLLSADETARKKREQATMQAVLLHDAAVARQQADAMQQAGAKQSRTTATASRIMHGKDVSPADEKELMEADPELYSLAKSAAMLEKHRRKHDEDDERISKQNDEARKAESQPKNYDIPPIETPPYEAQMSIDFDGDAPQIISVAQGTADD